MPAHTYPSTHHLFLGLQENWHGSATILALVKLQLGFDIGCWAASLPRRCIRHHPWAAHSSSVRTASTGQSASAAHGSKFGQATCGNYHPVFDCCNLQCNLEQLLSADGATTVHPSSPNFEPGIQGGRTSAGPCFGSPSGLSILTVLDFPSPVMGCCRRNAPSAHH